MDNERGRSGENVRRACLLLAITLLLHFTLPLRAVVRGPYENYSDFSFEVPIYPPYSSLISFAKGDEKWKMRLSEYSVRIAPLQKEYYLHLTRDRELLNLPKDLPEVALWGKPSLAEERTGREVFWHASFPSATSLSVVNGDAVVFEVAIPTFSFNGGSFTTKEKFTEDDVLTHRKGFYRTYFQLALLTGFKGWKKSADAVGRLLSGEWKDEWNLHSSDALNSLRRAASLVGVQFAKKGTECSSYPCFFLQYSDADRQSGILLQTVSSVIRIPLLSAYYDESGGTSPVKHVFPCYHGHASWQKRVARVSESPLTEEEWNDVRNSSREMLEALTSALNGEEFSGEWVKSALKAGNWTFHWRRLSPSSSYLVKVNGEWYAHLEWRDAEVKVRQEEFRRFRDEWAETLSQKLPEEPAELYRTLCEEVPFEELVNRLRGS